MSVHCFRRLRTSWLRMPTFAENNRYYVALLAALPAAAGSTVSVLLVISDVWALISLGFGRFRLRYLRSDMWVVLPAVFYSVVMAASILLRLNGPADLGLALTPAMYMTVPLLVARCRITPEVDYFGVFVRAAPLCGILLLPIMVWQVLNGEPRVTGFAGNAFPFSMICAFLGPVALLNLSRRSHLLAVFSLVGFLSCAAGVMLSGTRSVWLVLARQYRGAWLGARHSGSAEASSRPARGPRRLFAAIAAMFFRAHRVEQRAAMLVQDYHALVDKQGPEFFRIHPNGPVEGRAEGGREAAFLRLRGQQPQARHRQHPDRVPGGGRKAQKYRPGRPYAFPQRLPDGDDRRGHLRSAGSR